MDALDLLSNDNYITVNKTLIKEIGLENAIVFGVLCGYQRGYGTEEFYKEQEKIIEDTGLTEYLVRKSIKELTDLKYILVVKKGMPAKYHYKINIELLTFKILTSSGAKFDTTCGSKNETTNKNNNKNELNNINNISNKKEIEKEKIEKIYNYYLDKAIHYEYAKTKKNDYKDIPEKQIKAIKKTLDNTDDIESIFQTIDRYFEVISNQQYYFDTYWNVEKFFGQGNAYNDFTDEGSKWVNYQIWKNKQSGNVINPYSSGEISKETAYPNQKNKGYI